MGDPDELSDSHDDQLHQVPELVLDFVDMYIGEAPVVPATDPGAVTSGTAVSDHHNQSTTEGDTNSTDVKESFSETCQAIFGCGPSSLPGSVAGSSSCETGSLAGSPSCGAGSLADNPSPLPTPPALPADNTSILPGSPADNSSPLLGPPDSCVAGSLADSPSILPGSAADNPSILPGSIADNPSPLLGPHDDRDSCVAGSLADSPSILFGSPADNPSILTGRPADNHSILPRSLPDNHSTLPGSLPDNPSGVFRSLADISRSATLPGAPTDNPSSVPKPPTDSPLIFPGSISGNPFILPGSLPDNSSTLPGSQADRPVYVPGSHADNPFYLPGPRSFSPSSHHSSRSDSSSPNFSSPASSSWSYGSSSSGCSPVSDVSSTNQLDVSNSSQSSSSSSGSDDRVPRYTAGTIQYKAVTDKQSDWKVNRLEKSPVWNYFEQKFVSPKKEIPDVQPCPAFNQTSFAVADVSPNDNYTNELKSPSCCKDVRPNETTPFLNTSVNMSYSSPTDSEDLRFVTQENEPEKPLFCDFDPPVSKRGSDDSLRMETVHEKDNPGPDMQSDIDNKEISSTMKENDERKSPKRHYPQTKFENISRWTRGDQSEDSKRIFSIQRLTRRNKSSPGVFVSPDSVGTRCIKRLSGEYTGSDNAIGALCMPSKKMKTDSPAFGRVRKRLGKWLK